jgi:hypothetical protein
MTRLLVPGRRPLFDPSRRRDVAPPRRPVIPHRRPIARCPRSRLALATAMGLSHSTAGLMHFGPPGLMGLMDGCCCDDDVCACCDQYDITFPNTPGFPAPPFPPPYGGNTFRVTRIIIGPCFTDYGSKYVNGDYANPHWRINLGSPVFGVAAVFLKCEETLRGKDLDGIPCCPEYASQTQEGDAGVTVQCVGEEEVGI